MIAEQAGSGILSLLDWMPTPPQERNSPSDCSAGPPPTQNLFKSFRTPGNSELEPNSSIGKPTNSLSPEKTISAFFSKRKMDSLHTLVEPGDKTRVCIRYKCHPRALSVHPTTGCKKALQTGVSLRRRPKPLTPLGRISLGSLHPHSHGFHAAVITRSRPAVIRGQIKGRTPSPPPLKRRP